jgi:transcriptional regulator with PAS, ATPase and Fis domain
MKPDELSQQRSSRIDESESMLIAASSKAFQNVINIARRVARFDSSVLITGETGVGKEFVARFIHQSSPRSPHSMLAINCGALPETLLESELFGHKAGTFTGAFRDRIGLFEQAARGTILLDEIGDISLATQVKLLRVLQEREILRIGENLPRKVDIRIVASTNRNLDEGVADGRFREDLLYRLRVIEIIVPPLRERPEDISPLTTYFVERLSKKLDLPELRIDKECLDFFQAYFWPGNVRELRNAIERAAIFCDGEIIGVRDLPPQIARFNATVGSSDSAPLRSLAEIEMDYIERVLKFTGGNRTHAAKILKIGLSTLWRKLRH